MSYCPDCGSRFQYDRSPGNCRNVWHDTTRMSETPNTAAGDTPEQQAYILQFVKAHEWFTNNYEWDGRVYIRKSDKQITLIPMILLDYSAAQAKRIAELEGELELYKVDSKAADSYCEDVAKIGQELETAERELAAERERSARLAEVLRLLCDHPCQVCQRNIKMALLDAKPSQDTKV